MRGIGGEWREGAWGHGKGGPGIGEQGSGNGERGTGRGDPQITPRDPLRRTGFDREPLGVLDWVRVRGGTKREHSRAGRIPVAWLSKWACFRVRPANSPEFSMVSPEFQGVKESIESRFSFPTWHARPATSVVLLLREQTIISCWRFGH